MKTMKMMTKANPSCRVKITGLYAITPDLADTVKLCGLVEACLKGGASLVQYRNKTASTSLREVQAHALLTLCRQYAVPLIINDFPELCLMLDADGVHVGAEDGNLAHIRAQLGVNKLLGVSCYNRFELAEEARNNNADYVAFGACFDSATKPAAVKAPLSLITRSRREIGLPVVAIGGITTENAASVIQSGADSIAVIGALFSAEDVTKTAHQISQLFIQTHHQDYLHDFSQSAVI